MAILGLRFRSGQPVSLLLRERAPLTLRLVGIGLLLSWAAALALALSAAWLRVSAYDALTTADQRNFSLHSRRRCWRCCRCCGMCPERWPSR